MQTEFLCISLLSVASGIRVKLADYKSALNPPVVYSTDRSKAVVPVLVLLFVALWFILRGDLFKVLSGVIFFLCLRANLSAFRTFVRFVLVWICRFPLPFGVWEGLWFVVVAVPGLFFDPFFSPFSIAITSLGEGRANLSAFRTFVRFALVCFFSVFSSSWCLRRNAACDCGTPWTSFFLYGRLCFMIMTLIEHLKYSEPSLQRQHLFPKMLPFKYNLLL